jgi:hypothetical protein
LTRWLGVEVHGATCFACIAQHASELAAADCPSASNATNYNWFCASGKWLPNMIFKSKDGLSWVYQGSVRVPSDLVFGGAIDTGSENPLLRLRGSSGGAGPLMMVMRYNYADHPVERPDAGKARRWPAQCLFNGRCTYKFSSPTTLQRKTLARL